MLTQKDYLSLVQKVERNTEDIQEIKSVLGSVVTKADLSDFMKLFDTGIRNEEILILDGEHHCGASSKDAGHRITTILEIKGIADYKTTLESLLSNRELKLKL